MDQHNPPTSNNSTSRPRAHRSNSALAKLTLPSRTTSTPTTAPGPPPTSTPLLRKPHLSLHHSSHHQSSADSTSSHSRQPQSQQRTKQSGHTHKHSHSVHGHGLRGLEATVRGGGNEQVQKPHHRGGGLREVVNGQEMEMVREGEEDAGSQKGRGRERREEDVRVEVERERGRRARREDLNVAAHDATRRLDTTWYSILDKVSLLRSTIASLQELSSASSRLNSDFEHDTDTMMEEMKRKIEEFGPVAEKHAKEVRELEERLVKSKEQTGDLNTRVEEARNRVRRWETRESEWQARTTRRIRVTSGTFVAFVVLLVAIAVFHKLAPESVKSFEGLKETGSDLGTDIDDIFSSLPSNIESVRQKLQSSKTQELDTAETCSATQTKDWVGEKMRVLGDF
ncbi:MAG: hypothetical protein M1820_003450 [Bogoriella megaspora]|nr:MAG: hypothetical protein M1820_003450 [Bogoriella megaspora]